MSAYNIDYYDLEGDLCHVWVEANSKQEAELMVRDEYWDIQKIIDIRKR